MMSDQDLRHFVMANIGNPSALRSRAMQDGFGIPDIARVSGYTPDQLISHFKQAGVEPPVQVQTAPMPVNGAGAGPTISDQAAQPSASGEVSMGGAGVQPGAPSMSGSGTQPSAGLQSIAGAGPSMSGSGTATGSGRSMDGMTNMGNGGDSPAANVNGSSPGTGAVATQADAAQAAAVLQAMARNGQQANQPGLSPDGAQGAPATPQDADAFQSGFKAIRGPYR